MPAPADQGNRRRAKGTISRFDSGHEDHLLLKIAQGEDDSPTEPTHSERCTMHSQTVRYARNGALGAIGLYVMIAIPLLGLSMHGGPTAGGSPLTVASALSASATATQTNR